MTALTDYFLSGSFSLQRLDPEFRTRVRLGEPNLIMVRHTPRGQRGFDFEQWWLCEFLDDPERLHLGHHAGAHRVRVLCAATWGEMEAKPQDIARLPWVSSGHTQGVDWNAPLAGAAP